MTDSANPGLGLAESIFKSLVWDTVVKVGLADLAAAAPWTQIWPISIIVDAIVDGVTDAIFNRLKLVVDLSAIALVNSENQAAFDKASVDLKIVAHDKGVDSDEFRKARDAAQKSLVALIHFNGV